VVFDASGNAKLIIYKKLSSKTRRDRQKDFVDTARKASPFTNYLTGDDVLPAASFSATHRGF